MAWFKKTRKKIAAPTEKPSRVPEGLMVKCPGCAQILYNKDLTTNLNVCPKCAHHFRMNAAERLRMLFDDAWVEYDRGLVSTDPLGFTDTKPYKSRLKAGHRGNRAQGRGHHRLRDDRRRADDGRGDGVRVHRRQHGRRGRREDRARRSSARSTRAAPVVIVCCSGGARMMEGALSLMQMAKICGGARAARSRTAAVHLRADRSDDRRRDRQLRDARRPEHRRAQGAHRLCRPARHRTDDPPEAARGFPAKRVPAREGHAGSRRRSAGHAIGHRQRAALHGRDAQRARPCRRAGAGRRGGRVRRRWPSVAASTACRPPSGSR